MARIQRAPCFRSPGDSRCLSLRTLQRFTCPLVLVERPGDGPARAARTSVSHAAISQVRGRLVARGLVRVTTHEKDSRRQVLDLTVKGRQRAARLAPLWDAIAEATRGLVKDDLPDLLDMLDRLETALDHAPLNQRVRAVLAGGVRAGIRRKPMTVTPRDGGHP